MFLYGHSTYTHHASGTNEPVVQSTQLPFLFIVVTCLFAGQRCSNQLVLAFVDHLIRLSTELHSSSMIQWHIHPTLTEAVRVQKKEAKLSHKAYPVSTENPIIYGMLGLDSIMALFNACSMCCKQSLIAAAPESASRGPRELR